MHNAGGKPVLSGPSLGSFLVCVVAAGCLAACGGGSGGGGGLPPGPPTITSISPPSIEAGSPGFTLTVNGSNLDSTCNVNWNLDSDQLIQLPTTFISSSAVQAPVPASQVASIGFAFVTLDCAGDGGYEKFLITGFPRTEVDVAANDIAWDAVHQVLYLSVPPTVSGGNSIAVLNPTTGKVISSQSVGNNPDVLAISSDDQFLYVGLDDTSSVQRLTLPDLGMDVNYSLGPQYFFAFDMQVAPGFPHTLAVSIGNSALLTPEQEGITIFDDAAARPKSSPHHILSSIQWNSNATEIFAADSGDTGFYFYWMGVDSTGITSDNYVENVFSSFNAPYGNHIHFDSATGLIYSDDRHVVTQNGGVIGTFAAPTDGPNNNRMVPDSKLNAAFFLYSNNCQFSNVGACYTLQSFDLTNFTYINSLTMSSVQGTPINMVRWGDTGMAFNTDTGQVYLVDISTLLQPAGSEAIHEEKANGLPRSHPEEKIVTTTRRRRASAQRDDR